jgi:hypothetical protein
VHEFEAQEKSRLAIQEKQKSKVIIPLDIL